MLGKLEYYRRSNGSSERVLMSAIQPGLDVTVEQLVCTIQNSIYSGTTVCKLTTRMWCLYFSLHCWSY